MVATTAQKVASQTVKESYPPTASSSRTDEPRPLPSEVASRPGKEDRLPHVFPFFPWAAPVPVGQDHPLRFLIPYHRTADSARLPTGPRPAQGEYPAYRHSHFPVH